MATRKPIALVSGLFEEVNTPTDKLDLAGNTTTDLAEGSNLYYTDARARLSVSVTDSGGDGSLAYNNSSGVITYTGPSASETRAHFSAANSGTGFGGLAYDNSTGVFTYSVVTASNIRQQISVTDAGGDGSLSYNNTTGVITYNGPTGTDVRSYFSVAVGSGLTYNSSTGEFGTSAIPNSQLANSSITFGSTAASLGGTVSSLSLTSFTASSYVNVGAGFDSAGSLSLEPGSVVFEGAVADAFETRLQALEPTVDRIISLPDASGTVALLTSLSVAAGSGLTYNSSTGEFGTNSIPNSQLQNSSITVGSTGIALGSSATTITGLSSITSTNVITNDSGFRIRNNSDITKQLAFDASAITTATTRTLTVPDASGTIDLNSVNNALSGANTFTNSTGQTFRQASTQDGFIIQGRAGGTSSYAVTFTTATLSANRTVTFPDLAGTVVLDGGPLSVIDSTFNIKDDGDNTKQLAFQCSGISTGTTRTLTVPNENGTISTQEFATAVAIALG